MLIFHGVHIAHPCDGCSESAAKPVARCVVGVMPRYSIMEVIITWYTPFFGSVLWTSHVSSPRTRMVNYAAQPTLPRSCLGRSQHLERGHSDHGPGGALVDRTMRPCCEPRRPRRCSDRRIVKHFQESWVKAFVVSRRTARPDDLSQRLGGARLYPVRRP